MLHRFMNRMDLKGLTDSKSLINGCLISLLNSSLRCQGIHDMNVVGLSPNFEIALVMGVKEGKAKTIGAVPVKTILPEVVP